MTPGFIALGILSILYYGCLVKSTKKWNSTFSWFWIVFGILNIALGIIVIYTPEWFRIVLKMLVVVLWLLFFIVEVIVLCTMISVAPNKLKYIIVLGAQVRGTELSGSLQRRVNRAIRYLKRNPETIVIVSGGQGKGENISEARAMADELLKNGIEMDLIQLEDKSTSTFENLKNSLQFVQDATKDKVGIVTNNFHIYRSLKLAKLLGYKRVYAIPASSELVQFLNYMVREFFAILVLIFRIWESKRDKE